MKKKIFSLIALAAVAAGQAEYRYVGGDISMLDTYENAGAKYLTPEGKPIADLLPWLGQEGMNAMRVRIFVNPEDYTGKDQDPNACQTVESVLPLCKRIKDAGMALMVDFHYSDTWADPAKQWTPASWLGLDDTQLAEKIYDYTKESLQTLVEAGAAPDFIQTGNEISYGMLWGEPGTLTGNPNIAWPSNPEAWNRVVDLLLPAAAKACREICPEAKTVIHTERVEEPDLLVNIYNTISDGVDWDIIGLSYYPYFHGKMPVLKAALDALTQAFPQKEIMIVETGYPYAWEVPGSDKIVDYAYTSEGQEVFAEDLVSSLLEYPNVNGLFWWWLEYNAYGTQLQGWYNAPLFDSRNGKATPALKTLCSFSAGNEAGVTNLTGVEDTRIWHDLNGRLIKNPSAPGIYICNGRKIIL